MKLKYKHLLLLLVLCSPTSILLAQTTLQPSYTLSSSETGSNKTYAARDYVSLKPGFSYNGSTGFIFKAMIGAGLPSTPPNPNGTQNDSVIIDPTQGVSVGSIAGSASVTPTGAATYQIPIEVPLGINGMQPQIGIAYNSQGGFGALGVGWDIAGESAVTIGGKNIYFDGLNDGIKLNTTDALYLDGQRLILLSGTHFQVGAVYGTETENYTRVKIAESSETWGIYFIVTTKDGKTMEYGNTLNSLQKSATGGTSAWVFSLKLNKVTDTYGNSITYTYSDNGQYLSRIDYAGQAVVFNYVVNTVNPKKLYIKDFLISQAKLLNTITLQSGSTTLKTYSFNYLPDKRLNTISLVASNNSTVGSTTVNWNTETGNIQQVSVGSNYDPTLIQNKGLIYSGDVDGDGYADRIELKSGTSNDNGHVFVYLYDKNSNTYSSSPTASLTFSATDDVNVPRSGSDKTKLTISDINHDGKDEIIVANVTYIYCYSYSNGQFVKIGDRKSLVVVSTQYYITEIGTNRYNQLLSANVNNDLFNDIIYTYNYSRYSVIGQFLGSVTGYRVFTGGSLGLNDAQDQIVQDKYYDAYQIGDFNADGKVDIFGIPNNSNFYNIIDNNVSEYADGRWNSAANARHLYTADFNGDGLSDILVQNADYTWKILTNNGFQQTPTATSISQLVNCSAPADGEIDEAIPIDYNGDGQMDIVIGDEIFSGSSFVKTTWYFYKNNNGSFSLENQFDISSRMAYFSADINGDGIPDLVFPNGNGYSAFTKSNASRKNLVANITNGMGLAESFTYKNFSGYDTYTTDEIAAIVRPLRAPLLVVDSYVQQDGNITLYSYASPKFHTEGKGFLGFSSVTASNAQNNVKAISNYDFNSTYLYPTLTSQHVSTILGTDNISVSTQNNGVKLIDAARKRYIPIVTSQTSTDVLKGLTQTVNTNYDNYPASLTQTSTAGNLTITALTTFTGPDNLTPYLPATITVTRSQDGETQTRSTAYSYQYNGTKITGSTETVDPGKLNSVVTTYSNYDNWGHPLSVTVAANGITRTSSVTYTSSGRFNASKTNALNETTTYKWNEILGLLHSESTPVNGVNRETSYWYNGLGDLITTIYPNGMRKDNTIQWAGSNDISLYGALYYTTSVSSGSAPVLVWYDALGREVKKDTYGLNNNKISVCTEYYTSGANKGRLYRVSEPYFAADPASKTWSKTVATYDDYGRPTLITTPLGNVTTVYNLLTTKITTPEGITETILNSAGQTATSKVNDKAVSYIYYASGLTKTATPEGGQPITMRYNLQGKRSALIDPDGGFIRSEYNGFGELTKEVQRVHLSGDSITTINTYKPDGRLESINRNNEITTYTYDPNNKNRVSSIAIPDKNTQTFGFDAFDRVTDVTETITANGTTKSYVTTKEYDVFGRIYKEIYPSGYYTVNTYDQYSNLTEVKDQSNRSVWKANLENARGRLTSISKGAKATTYGYDSNGMATSISAPNVVDMEYHFTTNGNLEYRTDNRTTQQERFAYDGQNRLTNWDIYQNGGLVKLNSHVYDPTTGNISTRTNFNISKSMAYGGNRSDGSAIGPHALATIAGTPGDIPSDELAVTYTDFKKIKTLTEGSKTYSISYGVDDQRRVSVQTVNGVTDTRYYVGNYEEVITGSVTKKIHYLSGAIFIQETNQPDKFYYSYADYQGSLIALTDESGNLVERYAYDPWGVRRNPDNWTQRDSRTTWIVNRGYTGHEHLDAFGIINMNGRVYDPATGMFFSPDPNLQAPGDWLNYNRYSYCMGNPLKYTDPSGNSWFSRHWKSIVTTVAAIGVGIGVGILTGGMGLVAAGIAGGSAGGFTSGALGTALNGGNFSQCLGAGVQGAIVGAYAGVAGGGAAQWMTGVIGTSVGAFEAGAAIGATGGAAGGFVGGSMGAWMNGASFGDGIMAGLGGAAIAAAAGGLIGGTIKGIDAVKNGKANFWDGHVDLDLSKGYGATIGGRLMMSHLRAIYAGMYEDVAMYEAASLGDGGVTLPEYGIVVGKGVYKSTVSYYKEIKQHEYGHILQYKQFLSDLGSEEAALSAYYQQVGAPSAFSATMHGRFWNHYTLAVEMEANRLSSAYFGSRYIPNPVKFPLNNAIFSFTIPLN